ncbi:hypothetical protein [Amaricoccus sp.]|uniref:hypothetical protein n=1 Tax=Amaricoccus sp. TaxID=1872485 RepID=UPI001B40B279|nr:hypothetical protein [Amaricoccus sp.]MBP7002435.1 hypothetical protein [Amaricoccus sp.]
MKFVRKLTDAGMDHNAAEAIAGGFADLDISDVATKGDILVVRSDLLASKSELQFALADARTELRSEVSALKRDLADLKAEMFRFMLVQALGIVGLTVTLIKVLP